MKVLIADKFEDSGRAGLKAAGCEVLYQPDLKDAALADAIRDSGAQVLVVRSTTVTAPMNGNASATPTRTPAGVALRRRVAMACVAIMKGTRVFVWPKKIALIPIVTAWSKITAALRKATTLTVAVNCAKAGP